MTKSNPGNTYISDKANVGQNVQIGNNTKIEDFCVIGDNSQIGDNVTIKSGSVIGAEPADFSISPNGIKRHGSLMHVVIGSGSEVGHNVVIHGGTSRNTTIGKNCFVNNLVNIGHDVVVGDNSIVGLSTTISGHSTVGDWVEISPGCTLINRSVVGSSAKVAIGSLVLNEVMPFSTVVGRPAIDQSIFKKQQRGIKELLGLPTGSTRTAPKRKKYIRLFMRIIRRVI